MTRDEKNLRDSKIRDSRCEFRDYMDWDYLGVRRREARRSSVVRHGRWNDLLLGKSETQADRELKLELGAFGDLHGGKGMDK